MVNIFKKHNPKPKQKQDWEIYCEERYKKLEERLYETAKNKIIKKELKPISFGLINSFTCKNISISVMCNLSTFEKTYSAKVNEVNMSKEKAEKLYILCKEVIGGVTF